jgi:hypothetical protein
MTEKLLPTYLIRTDRSIDQNTTLIVRQDGKNDNTRIEIDKGDRDGCHLLPVLFTLTKSSKIDFR